MEDQELKALLQQSLKLTQENNKMLHAMRRSARWGIFFRIIYWFVILGGLAFSYYFIQPYLTAVLGAYEQIQGSLGQIQEQRNALPDFSKLLETLKQEAR